MIEFISRLKKVLCNFAEVACKCRNHTCNTVNLLWCSPSFDYAFGAQMDEHHPIELAFVI